MQVEAQDSLVLPFRSATLLKRGSDTGVFLLILPKFLRTPILKNICERRLLSEIKILTVTLKEQKQPPRGVLRKKCSENMQQIYRGTPMPKRDFNKVAKQHLCIFSEHL